MAYYEIWLTDDAFKRLAPIERRNHPANPIGGFSYSQVANGVGVATVALPDEFDLGLVRANDELARDRCVQVWRAPEGGQLGLERTYFLRKAEYAMDAKGRLTTTVTGLDANDLLRRRIVAYYSGSSQSDRTGKPDDLMKAFTRDNLGSSATVAARNLTANGFTVDVDLGLGTSLSKADAWTDLPTVMKDLADASYAAGQYLYWDIVPVTPTTLQFRAYLGQPGTDRTWPGGKNPVILGVEYGNLAEPDLVEDYTGEVDYIYAGGQGEGADRLIVEVSDATRIAASRWNRCEAFVDARNEADSSGVTAAANAALAAGRPVKRFTAKLVETPETRYGVDWFFGDKVSASFLGRQYDATITGVSIAVDDDGRESIDCKLETYDVT